MIEILSDGVMKVTSGPTLSGVGLTKAAIKSIAHLAFDTTIRHGPKDAGSMQGT